MTIKNAFQFNAKGYHDCNGQYENEQDIEDETLPLYRFQSSLPSLPIPSIEETCKIYLESIQPLARNAKELQETQLAVEDFRLSIGHVLQDRLKQRQQDKKNKNTSWLAEWWNTLGYLQVRDNVVFNVNYFFHFADSIHPLQSSQVGRAASLIIAAKAFRDKVVSGELEPEQLGRKKKIALCATAYKYMFHSCRIPGIQEDQYRMYDPIKNEHVCIIKNNAFYILQLGPESNMDTIALELYSLVHYEKKQTSVAIGALTSQDRHVWAKDRLELLQQDGNEETLRKIESSMFILCLDDTSPMSRTCVSRAIWHGDGQNRFFDKTIQFIVFANGKAGLLAEHSMLDGMAMGVFADWVLRSLNQTPPSSNYKSFASNALVPSMTSSSLQKLNFNYSPVTLDAIHRAIQVFTHHVSNREVEVESFYGFGKTQIKGFRCSPDAFVQMAMQLAYRKMFNESAATYEATQVRIFLHGRTETTRSLSIESAAWTKAMVEDHPGVPTQEKLKLLQHAIAQHIKYIKRAVVAKGVDRHLFGLKQCLLPGEHATLFDDPLYARSKHWKLSTSNMSNELFDGWGYGEVVPDGLGVAYMIKNNSCHFNIVCRKLNWARPFCHYLEESLLEMRDLCMAFDPSASRL